MAKRDELREFLQFKVSEHAHGQRPLSDCLRNALDKYSDSYDIASAVEGGDVPHEQLQAK